MSAVSFAIVSVAVIDFPFAFHVAAVVTPEQEEIILHVLGYRGPLKRLKNKFWSSRMGKHAAPQRISGYVNYYFSLPDVTFQAMLLVRSVSMLV